MKTRLTKRKKVLEKIYLKLKQLWQACHKYRSHEIMLSKFIAEFNGAFAYADHVEVSLERGEPVYGKFLEIYEFDKRLHELTLVPLCRGNEIVAFELIYNYKVKAYDYKSESTYMFIVAREPLRITIRRNPPYLDTDSSFDWSDRDYSETRGAIVGPEIFEKCLRTYNEALSLMREVWLG